MAQARELGGNFSQVQCSYFGLDEKQTVEAFHEILGLGFNVIRLGSYWNEIEPKPRKFNFRVLDNLLNEAIKSPTKIALSVGIKSPRYPEFFFPSWIKDLFPEETAGKKGAIGKDPKLVDLTLRYIEKVVEETKGCPNITHWQIENEPLVRVPFAPLKTTLLPKLVSKEVSLVKILKRDDQKILMNMSVNPIPFPFPGYDDKRQFTKAIELADAVGLNIYSCVAIGSFIPLPFLSGIYAEPTATSYYWNKISHWRQQLEQLGKEAWVTESQAEPWEAGNYVHTKQRAYPSVNPQRASELATKLMDTGFSPVLLWGCEHWYWHKIQGHMEWWNEMQQLIDRNT